MSSSFLLWSVQASHSCHRCVLLHSLRSQSTMISSGPRNLDFEVHPVLRPPRNLHVEVTLTLRIEVYKVLRLPRSLHKNAVFATKSALRGSQSCACHEICTSRFAKSPLRSSENAALSPLCPLERQFQPQLVHFHHGVCCDTGIRLSKVRKNVRNADR